MSVGILIITHNKIGQAMLETVNSVMGDTPLPTRTMAVSLNCRPEEMTDRAKALVDELDEGEGVLILTDMYGSTPSNIACRLEDHQTVAIAGLNLPMLIRLMNYPQMSMSQLVQKAVSGGQEGVVVCCTLDQMNAAKRSQHN